MQQGHRSKTDGRGMRQYNYGQHCVPKAGVNGVSRARREADKVVIGEELRTVVDENSVETNMEEN